MQGNDRYQEINTYRDTSFPVNVYRADIHSMQPKGRWLHDFHWHEELQFTLVRQGSLVMQVGGTSLSLKAGDSVFINSGMIHAVTDMTEDGEYASLNFPYRLLAFYTGSRMEHDCVLPYVTGSAVPYLVLSKDGEEAACAERICGILERIRAIYASGSVQGQEYRISVLIVSMWLELISGYDLSSHGESTGILYQKRLQQMISYVSHHYMEDIGVSDIAQAAGVSTAECTRLFRSVLRITPHNYVRNYRIHSSVQLLRTDLSITEIAGRVGYNQVSNYIANFRSVIGQTPAKYRRGILDISGQRREKDKQGGESVD